MNKKYAKYIVLMMFLMVCKPSFSMQARIAQYIVNCASIFSGSYILGKIMACYKESRLPDAPHNVQFWARAILREKGIKNADSVPLKVGEGWAVYGGRFIQMNQDGVDYLESNLTKNSLVVVSEEKSLLHEGKHYHNGDFGKGVFFLSAAIAPCVQAVSKNCFKRGLLLGMVGMMSEICHMRYQEAEANRFAFMNFSSIQKLEVTKNYYVRSAEDFEYNLLHYPLRYKNNLLENIARPMLSERLHSLNQKALESSHDQKQFIDIQKRGLIKLAHFIFDPKHPDFRRQVAIAQECLDKRRMSENRT
jgi:hypothetical protein